MAENGSRRSFIRGGAVGAALTAAGWSRISGANNRLRLGVIGTGNRGSDVMSWFLKEPDVEVVALCDCYERALTTGLS